MTNTNDVTAESMEQLYALYGIQAALQQIYTNISLVYEGATGQVISITNANLFVLAAQYYGDATAWTVIAQANGLTDPYVSGTRSITIPSAAISTGGILNA